MVVIWLSVIIILAIIEFLTVNLVTIWFIASGFIALILAFLNITVKIQFGTFVIIGIILLFTTRKSLQGFVNKHKEKTNLDSVVGEIGIVTEDISEDSAGEVKVKGKKWTAIAKTDIKKDKKVKILKIEGVKLIVEEV